MKSFVTHPGDFIHIPATSRAELQKGYIPRHEVLRTHLWRMPSLKFGIREGLSVASSERTE